MIFTRVRERYSNPICSVAFEKNQCFLCLFQNIKCWLIRVDYCNRFIVPIIILVWGDWNWLLILMAHIAQYIVSINIWNEFDENDVFFFVLFCSIRKISRYWKVNLLSNANVKSQFVIISERQSKWNSIERMGLFIRCEFECVEYVTTFKFECIDV